MKTIIVFVAVLLLAYEFAYSKGSADLKTEMGSCLIIKNTEDAVATDPKVVPVYFVLGTLSDYLGRFYAVERSKQVDQYDGTEKPLVDYLQAMINAQPGMKVDSLAERKNKLRGSSVAMSKKYLLYCDVLSDMLNNFYGKDDHLIDSLITTHEQIYSFLAGVYYRYGDRLDSSIYKIQMANSSKPVNCQALLGKVGCKKVVYKHVNVIPAQNIVYFTPTDELINYFNAIEKEKLLLRESSLKAYQEIFKETLSKEEFEKGFLDLKVKELNSIKDQFN